jgi:hypothetical protein
MSMKQRSSARRGAKHITRQFVTVRFPASAIRTRVTWIIRPPARTRSAFPKAKV